MKWTMILLAMAAAFPISSVGQNCSEASMESQGSSASVPCNSTNSFKILNESDFYSYQDICTNENDDSVYYSKLSTVAGVGQCMAGSGSNPTIYRCPAVGSPEVVPSTTGSGYNQFYNRAYGNLMTFADGNAVCEGAGTGPFAQDYQQCAAVACPPPATCCNGGIHCSSTESCITYEGHCGCDPTTPIMVDTTGRGFHLTSAADGVSFDFFGTRQPIKMSWTAVDSGNAFLALDRNHNGKIDSGKELFGNLNDVGCDNGYCVLAWYDKPENGGNGDGIIDWRDAVFSKLLLWIDANHDGISQPQELHTLPELGVYSISLKYKDESMHDEYGNWFRYRAALNPDPLDGKSKDGRFTYDVFLVPWQTTTTTANCPSQKQVSLDKLQ